MSLSEKEETFFYIMRNELNQLTTLLPFTPKTFMEIGSRDGEDTDYVAKFWKLAPEDCHIIEAYPQLAEQMKQKYPYNVHSFAASHENGEAKFNAVVSEHADRVGMSSLLDHNIYHNKINVITVETKRMDSFLTTPIDLIKLDVEGHAYSVLVGFGDKLKDVKAIQVETEKSELWKGQKTHEDVKSLLESFGFELVSIFDAWDAQYDCLFVNKAAI